MPGRRGAANLKNGTPRKPEIMPAMAPRTVMPDQNKERIMIGQKVAAIPDQPKMTNQKMVRSGLRIATVKATKRAIEANTRVAQRLADTSVWSPRSGRRTFW